jgi:hypothetical protein
MSTDPLSDDPAMAIDDSSHSLRGEDFLTSPSAELCMERLAQHTSQISNGNGTTNKERQLEERLDDLESKLATLSRLLQLQHATKQPHTSTTTEHSTLTRDNSDDSNDTGITKTIKPPHHKRNLSFQLLYDQSDSAAEYEQRRSSAPPQSSMTKAEREWVQPKLLKVLGLENTSSHGSRDHHSRDHHSAGRPPKSPVPLTSLFTKQQPPTQPTTTSTTKTTQQSLLDDAVRTNWLSYLNSFQESTSDVDEQMQNFIKVPGQVENILNFGLFVCADSFLYMITILPIRFAWSLALLAYHCALRLLKKGPARLPFRFHRRHSYQIVQVAIVYGIYAHVLGAISVGRLYHWIRGQSMIKVYVLIAMVEVFDRLFSSLGQDCLESMYWNTVSRPWSSRMYMSVSVVAVYATVHALILFLHVETLNVAINSADQALLTLLISGNFAEIKSTCFKKYNNAALFKITASDICERFKLGLFLSLILLLNVAQGMEKGQFTGYLRMCGLVWCSELLSDWIKHAFITKFNFLPAKVYPSYALLLAGDVTGIGHEGVNLDHSHAVVKRIGFAQIPLVCVMFRLIQEATKYSKRNPWWQETVWNKPNWQLTLLFAAGWLVLLGIKTALGQLLHRMSLNKLRAAPEFHELYKLPKNKKNL